MVPTLAVAKVPSAQNSTRTLLPNRIARHVCGLVFCLTAFGSAAWAQSPVPYLNEPLVPANAVPGAAGLTLTVNGSGFVAASQINWNGVQLATTFVSASRVTAVVPAANLAAQTSAAVTVVNPAPSQGPSNPILFLVTPSTNTVTTAETDLSPPGTPAAVVAADFNADGKPDLAVVSSGGTSEPNSVSIYLGNGDGTFAAPQTFAVGTDPVALVAADFNGDGKVDLAVLNDQDATVSLLLGNGDGTFQPQTTTSTGQNPVSIVAGDFNSDGYVDLAIANTSATVSVLLGKGDGTFTAKPDFAVGSHPIGIAAGDLNGDGHLDLAIADAGINVVFVLFGNNDGTFTPSHNYPIGTSPHSVIAVDLNGDGILDLVTADENCSVGPCPAGLVTVLLGNSGGTFQPKVSYPTGATAYQVVPGDFNGDGFTDLATANMQANSGSVLLGDGTGKFAAPINFPVNGAPTAIAASDFNSDGRLDLALASDPSSSTPGPSINVLLQAGVASLSASSLTFPSENFAVAAPTQTVTLNNSGSAALAFSGVSIAGTDSADFSVSGDCGAIIPIAGSCTMTVTFVPQASGTRIATLNVTTGPAYSPSVGGVILTGTGIAPGATLNVSALAFNPQIVSTASSTQSFNLSSTGNVVLAFTSLSVTGANAADFSANTTCPATITVGSNCPIYVTFTPTAGGSRSATLTITDSAPGGSQTVNLSGIGQDFTLASTGSGSQSIPPGQTTSFPLQITPLGGFNQSVTLSCSGVPTTITCTVQPASTPLNGSTTVNVTVAVATEAASAVPSPGPGGPNVTPWSGARYFYLSLIACLLLLFFAIVARREGLTPRAPFAPTAVFVLLIVLCAGLSACVGSSSGGSAPHFAGTPAGTYTLTITGSSAPLTHTVSLSLKVE